MAAAGRVQAPELAGDGWIGCSGPLSIAGLRGRIVLLAFLTTSRVECLRAIDQLRALARRFGDELVVIGVHTPRFTHEADPRALEAALERLAIDFPLVHDPARQIWDAYGVTAWPTLVLVDPTGAIALHASGDGRAEQVASAIETVARAHAAAGTLQPGTLPLVPRTPAPATALRFPSALAHDPQRGLLAVSDTGHRRVVLLDAGSLSLVATVGGAADGRADGPFQQATFGSPQGACFHAGALWTCDASAGTLRRIDLDRQIVETAATGLRSPWDVAVFGGILTIAMAGAHQLWGFDPASGRLGALAGTGQPGQTDGPAAGAQLAQPSALATADRMLGFVDADSSALRVVAPRPMGGHAVATVVGAGLQSWGDADGPSTHARLQHPQGLAAVPGGFIVADTYNHRLRRFQWETGRVETLAGLDAGNADGSGPQARFCEPQGLVLIGERLIVADSANHALRSVDVRNGETTTLQPRALAAPGQDSRTA